MSPGNTTPPWPSLYNPGLEILHIEHRPPTQKGAEYLYSASDIFRFTLYWNLIFYTPPFLVCGLYAFWNYSFPPSPRPSQHPPSQDTLYPLTPLPFTSRTLGNTPLTTHKKNERRSRLAFALLVLLTFMTLSVAGAVIGAAILGFVAMGLYRAGNFNMSTWIPFLLAVIQVFVGLLRYVVRWLLPLSQRLIDAIYEVYGPRSSKSFEKL